MLPNEIPPSYKEPTHDKERIENPAGPPGSEPATFTGWIKAAGSKPYLFGADGHTALKLAYG